MASKDALGTAVACDVAADRENYKETDMGTTIRQCSCKHDYQDNKYGPGNRVHNEGMKVDRCTVCGNDKSKATGK